MPQVAVKTIAIMEINEIKKDLYKRKLKAKFVRATKSGLVYTTDLNSKPVNFIVPLEEIGDAAFYDMIDAQLLIRYIALA